MTPAQLVDAALDVAHFYPTAELVKNDVGNLAIVIDGAYVGWIDLREGGWFCEVEPSVSWRRVDGDGPGYRGPAPT